MLKKKGAVKLLFDSLVRSTPNARPFLKWVGGKSQLLDELYKRLPKKILETGNIERYVEPFVGGGALFFFLKQRFKIKESYLFDINQDLVLVYNVIKYNVENLISFLSQIEEKYLKLSSEERKNYYYEIRTIYNEQKKNFDYKGINLLSIERAGYLIFLNKTCYNGLYRTNKKGEFNVPFGKYKNPSILDEENLLQVKEALKNTEIICGDFELSREYIQQETLVYLDPPYRPISRSSSFTSYTDVSFDDNEQVRLAKFFRDMDNKRAYLLLSNSDPKNEDPNDDFFDKLYSGYIIERVKAKRYVNCVGEKRGEINEILIRNYKDVVVG